MAQTSFNRILVIAMLAAFLVEDAASFHPSSFCNTPLVSKKSAVSGFKRGGLCGLRMATAKEVVFVDERRAFSRRSIATLTKKAKQFLSSYRDGAPDGALLAPDFQFIGSSPHIGGGQFYCFSIDPYETNRVWFNARMSAHVAQSCSLIFTSEGLVKQFTMHIIDEILESLPFSTKDLLPFPTPIETLSIPISSSIPSTGAQVEQELQQEVIRLKLQMRRQQEEKDAELASLREQFQRLDGAQFANELNMQVKSKQLVAALEQLAEKTELLSELREKYEGTNPLSA